MRKLSSLPLLAALCLLLAPPVRADAISVSPGEALLWNIREELPLILILALLIVTAVLIRKFTKKK